MVESNVIVGITIIIINLLPILFKKYKLLIITGAISVLLGILLMIGII
ncbi:MAG: hypothetical protein Q8N63_01145 [Nanoarchaeota archaeon]|nr:hypothetical protein [Nanoarchaeota archaeon]